MDILMIFCVCVCGIEIFIWYICYVRGSNCVSGVLLL